jgi:hypothetical protein
MELIIFVLLCYVGALLHVLISALSQYLGTRMEHIRAQYVYLYDS